MNIELKYIQETGLPSRKRNTGNKHSYTNEYIEWLEQKALDLKTYRNELLNKLDAMVITANKLFAEDDKEVTKMVIENVKYHVNEISKNLKNSDVTNVDLKY